MILYRCVFAAYDGTRYLLDTTDQAKIGPWLAEMFALFPYNVSTPTAVDIRALAFGLG
jgi:hypothetical protein